MANIRNLAALAALGAAGAMAMRDRKDKAPVEDREKPKDKVKTKPVEAAKEDAAVINASSDDDSFSRDLASERLSAQQNKGITTNARGEAVPMRRAAPSAPVAPAAVAPAAVSPAAAAVSANLSDMPPYRSVRPIRRGTDNVSAAPMAEAASTDKEPSLSLPPYRSVRPMRRGEEMKSGGTVKKMASGGSVSARGDGIAQRGKTRGRFV